MDAAPTQTPQLSGNVLFYSQPEPLSKEAHAKLGVKKVDNPFSFAAKANVVPVTVPEFAPAALSYPIIFAGDLHMPLAVMGLSEGQNLYFIDEKRFETGAYMPAYIRRYPFVLAGDEKGEQMVVCIDRGSPLIGENAEAPFFENGELTPFTQNCLEFCNAFESDRRQTESFVKLLTDLDLFELKVATFTPQNEDGSAGEPQQIADYFGVSEQKLNALPAAKLAELRDSGALRQIYIHLNSLLGWDKLIAKGFERAQRELDAAAAANT
jgi:hypothetical protein